MSTERRSAVPHGLYVLGLIGRTGSGKSSAARALETDGAVVIDADRLGHDITDNDPEVRAALVAEYGPEVYRADGTLDRPRVAARIFSDPAARERLDKLVHPRIIARARETIDALAARGFVGVIVIDAALLLDWGLERWCDAVIAVVAPEPIQIERLVQSRGWTREQSKQRLSVQRSQAAYRAAADVTLENDGTRLSLETAAREALRAFRERERGKERT